MSPPAADYLKFLGKSWIRNYSQTFSVLCGDNPPTITDGYAQWQVVPRPLQTGVTDFIGYNPGQMTCELRFGSWGANGWDTSDTGGNAVEADISKLEWMAGANFGTGRSPIIAVAAYNPQGGISDLIPPAWRKVTWVITALEWDQAWRNQNGLRVYQDAKVTLTKYVGYDRSPLSGTTSPGAFQTSKNGADTPMTIVTAYGSSAYNENLARQIVQDPHNAGLQLRSVRSQIPHGAQVWVPASITGSNP